MTAAGRAEPAPGGRSVRTGPEIVPVGELLAEGRAALRAGDPVRARAAFERARTTGESGDVLDGLARASYLELNFRDAITLWERAYAAYRATDDQIGAVRMARTLAGMYGQIVGDLAVFQGWMSRAQTLLAGAGDQSEAGWVSLNRGMFEANRARKEEFFQTAIDIARSVGDSDLEFVSLAYLGASRVHGDRVDEGMPLLDEALAAVAGNDVDDFCALEEIFCQLFAACEYAHDVSRAEQWMRVGDAVAARRKLPAVSAFCHTHYGGVLTVAGRWREADAALTDAIRLWALGARSQLRGGALVRLAGLRVRQGRLEEAAQLLEGWDFVADPDAAVPQASIHLARGEASLARDTVQRALHQVDLTSAAAAPLLALLVEASLAAGVFDDAESAAAQLAVIAAAHPSQHLRATAAFARGRVQVASGATGDPLPDLREAVAGFASAQMPLEAARARLVLATALTVDRPEVAIAEARAALETFERLHAARYVDEAAALLRSLGVRPTTAFKVDGILTKRETEVLELLGRGLSNPEISARLFISRKTVEHHVGNILSKLGLRSRAEAAAYIARAILGTK